MPRELNCRQNISRGPLLKQKDQAPTERGLPWAVKTNTNYPTMSFASQRFEEKNGPCIECVAGHAGTFLTSFSDRAGLVLKEFFLFVREGLNFPNVEVQKVRRFVLRLNLSQWRPAILQRILKMFQAKGQIKMGLELCVSGQNIRQMPSFCATKIKWGYEYPYAHKNVPSLWSRKNGYTTGHQTWGLRRQTEGSRIRAKMGTE